MYFKKLFLVTILCLFSSLGWSDEKEIKFLLSCQIEDQIILKMSNGKPERYSKFTEGKKKGDTFRIGFYAKLNTDHYQLSLSQELEEKPVILLTSSLKNIDWLGLAEEIDKDFLKNIHGDMFFRYKAQSSSEYRELSALDYRVDVFFDDMLITSNKIEFNYSSFNKSAVKLKRYYRDDWQLNFSANVDGGTVITLANCMNMPEKYNEMLIAIKDWHLANK